MTEHKIEYRSLGEIHPYDNNPRDNDAAVKPTAESIRQFGFQSPIIVDKDGVIIAGHTRYKAAKRLHLDKVPVIVASELTPEQVKAYRIADNSTGEVAKWNIDLLTAELASIKLDMAQFGLEVKLDTNTEVEDDGYEVALPDAPITKPGDLWILGEHRVLCGSATDANDMARLMEKTRADLLLTDPPLQRRLRRQNCRPAAHPERSDGRKPIPPVPAAILRPCLRCLPHGGRRVYLPRRHRGGGVPGHVPGSRLGTAWVPGMGEEHHGSGPQRLPMAA